MQNQYKGTYRRPRNELQEFSHVYSHNNDNNNNNFRRNYDSRRNYQSDRNDQKNNNYNYNYNYNYEHTQNELQEQQNNPPLSTHEEKIYEVIDNPIIHQDFLLGDSFKKTPKSMKNQEVIALVKSLQKQEENNYEEEQKSLTQNQVQNQNQEQFSRIRRSRLQQQNTHGKEQNILMLLRIQQSNQFSKEELITENEILADLPDYQEENIQELLPLTFGYRFQQQLQTLKFVEFELLIVCGKCQNVLQIKTELTKKYSAPSIKTTHCKKEINFNFLIHHKQQWVQTQKSKACVGYLKTCVKEFVIINAILDVYCQCGNLLENSLILDSPSKLSSDNYILGATQYYRKLCHQCCKEVVIQDFELYF